MPPGPSVTPLPPLTTREFLWLTAAVVAASAAGATFVLLVLWTLERR